MFMLFAVLSISAFAGFDDKYYWFYNKVEAEPTGCGKIYADIQKTMDDYPEAPTEDAYVNSKEIKDVILGASTGSMIYVWAQPAEGYQFVGWYQADAENPETKTFVDSNAETTISVTTEHVTDSEDVEGYGFAPDATYYGVFAKVKVDMESAIRDNDLASVEINKIANQVGDEVTITATPIDETTTFDYWTDSKGDKITDNPYTFTVTDIDTYTAHFSSEKILIIDFGEGKFIPFSNVLSATLNENITGYRVEEVPHVIYEDGYEYTFDETKNAWGYWDVQTEYNGETDTFEEVSRDFIEYTGEIPSFVPTYKITSFGFNYNANDGVILYGEGEQMIVLREDEYATPWAGSFLVATCDGAVDIASLPAKDEDDNALTYYVFDGADFVKATSGTVEKDQCYLVLDAKQDPIPEKIIFASSEAVGIEEVPTGNPATPQFMGIYTIDGMQVAAPVKGLNIIGGRKVWVKE